jgi:two-component system cell cycle sensor histidine kinase/response regulator CckA
MDTSTKPVGEKSAQSASPLPQWLAWKGAGDVLVIDDDESVRTVLMRTLQKIGFTVTLAGDGSEALERFSADPSRYRLVLLDYKLPGMDSKSVLSEMRTNKPALPVILMSGYCREEAAGPTPPGSTPCEFLHKPFTMDVLASKVRHAVGS